jgi:two-component system response regulator EvgA
MFSAIVIDAHPFIRASVKMLLKRAQFDVVAEGANGADAIKLAAEHKPDLIVLDISLPELRGLEVIARISAQGLSGRILVLTSQPAIFYAMRCMGAGADGFVSKSKDLEDLIRAIDAVMEGYTFFPNLNVNTMCLSEAQVNDLELIKTLSNRELSILQQLSTGLSNQKIGDAMLVSSKTVSTYKSRLIDKLDLKSVVCLAAFAKRNNLA